MTSPPINQKEFAFIIRQHSRIINKISYFYANEKLPFDDLRQEIYVNIWLGLKQFRGDSKMSTWIYRVAVNSALMALRSSKRKIDTVSLDFGLSEISSEIDDAQKENLQTLHLLINRLEDVEKAIILLWLDEYSYDEIADTIGLKRGTVATKTNSQNISDMQLDELKKSMSVLDQVLAKTYADIKINVSASQTAQTSLLKKYRQSFTVTAILTVVFALSWMGDVNLPSLPVYTRIFLVTYLALDSVWYIFMYIKLKKTDIAQLTPAKLFSKTTTLKLYALSGEILFGIGAVVFFTLFLSNMPAVNRLAFWLCVGTLFASLIWSVWYLWPKYIKLFRDLKTIK